MVLLWKEGVELEEYVFFFIDLFAEGLAGQGPVRPWYRGDQEDYAARQAFRVRGFLMKSSLCLCSDTLGHKELDDSFLRYLKT